MTARVDVIIDIAWTTLCTSCSGLRSIPAWLKYSRTARRTAGVALDGRQKVSFTISSGATAAYDARRWSLGKTKTSGSVRTRLQAKSSIWLLRPYESRIELAPHQGLGQRWGVITRQADFDARKLVSKDAVHLRQQTDFRPRQKAKGERRSRRLSGAQRRFFCCVRLKQRHSCMVGKRFAGRRQLNTVSPTIHQLNADFLFEIPNLPAERWLGRVKLLLGGNGQTARISNRDEVAEMPKLHHNL